MKLFEQQAQKMKVLESTFMPKEEKKRKEKKKKRKEKKKKRKNFDESPDKLSEALMFRYQKLDQKL